MADRDAALLDLYDTVAESDWWMWRDRLSSIIGVDPPALDEAFRVTRPERSIGTYGSVEGDMAAVLAAIGFDPPPPELVRELASFENEFTEEHVRLYPDARNAVESLRERGIVTVLVSNCSYNTRAVVDHLSLERLFDALILSFEVGAYKPQPAIYHAALRAAGDPPPPAAVFVDDQASYCDGARRLGIDTRLILRPGADPPESFAPDTNSHTVITDLTSLLES
jgi:HAD superfamily hydrolase (TIGR01509 family)